MSVRKYYLIVLLLFVSFSPAISQSLRVSRFTEEEGLPSPLVKSIVRDKQGIVWAATDDGLVRFDGREFRLFQDELPGLYAKSVFCLPSGEMLVTTDMGISLFGDEAGKVNFETIGRGGLHQSDTLMWFPKMIFNDQAGNVWFSDNSKVYQYVDKRFRSYNLGSEVSTNNFNRSFSFSGDGMGHFYAFAEPGLVFRYEQKKDKLVPVILPAEITGIHAVFNVSKGIILIATSGGLYELKIGKDLTVISLRLVSKKDISYIARNSKGRIYAGTWAEGLFILTSGKNGAYQFDAVSQYPEKVVNHLYIDKEDNVWASTDVGILLLQETLFGSPFSHLTTSYIQSISKSASGDIYFTDGNQIFRSESGKLGMTFKVFQSVTAVLQVIPVTDGFWIADAEGRIMFCNNKGVRIKTFDFNDRGRAVFKLLIDHEENVWACQDANEDLIRISYDFHVEFYGIEKGLVSRPISLGMSAGGKIYCGGMTDSAYLFEYNPLKNQFENLSKRIDFERNIDLNINDIVCASDGSLWLGSSFGLISYRDGVFNRADLGKLSGNSVKAVAIDSLGYIWFANNKGLYRYLNGDKLLFDERNGLPSKNIAYRGLLIDANNRMWAGTLAGMAVSGELVKPRHTMMPIVRRFIVNNISQPFNPAVSTVVNNKSFISINVASPEYPSKQLSYEYFIEGEDSTWKSIPNDGVLLVGDLSPGEYKLKVRAHQTGNFTYSESLIWNLTITRIWYEKWWVIALLIIVPILVIRLLWQLNSRRLRSDNEKLEKLISERTQEIVLQSEHIEKQNARIIRKNDALSLKNKELELAKNLAEEATKAKSQFLSVMSHEIRTPMNAVIGVTHLLMRDNPRPDQLEDLKILKFSAENLLGLINDILDLNKIEAGKLVIESIDFNLKSLAEGVRGSMLHKATEKGIFIDFSYDETLPLFFLSDPLRISQILNNLLSNAIKFTRTGGVTIKISHYGIIDSRVAVGFSVSDTGIGIPKEMHERIFAEFTQASSDTSRNYGGTGLGLAITVKLLEMLGSSIQLESEPEKGSLFSFVIKMKEGQVSRNLLPDGMPGKENQRFNGQRILLVEDNVINEVIARKFMEDWNLNVDSASNGLEAIEKLNQENFHLILMDLQMPEMDGFMTTSIIRGRGHEPFISIPIIALTASSKSEVQDEIMLAGMNDFVSKPFNPDELWGKLKKYLKV